MRAEKQCHIRHLAFQIIAQLPEDETAAVRVLDYARQVLLNPLAVPAAEIVPLKIVDKGSSANS